MAHRFRSKWRGSVRHNGQKFQKTFSTKKLAQIWEGQKKYDLEKKEIGIDIEDSLSIDNLSNQYLKFCREFKKLRSAIREEQSIKKFLEFCGKKLIFTCSDIERKTWKKYADYRKDVSNTTINFDLKTINRMFKWAMEEELVTKNPFASFKSLPVAQANKPQYLTPKEIIKLREFMQNHNHYKTLDGIFYVLIATGIRCDELCNIKEKDVDVENRKLYIPSENTKANYARVIPLNDECIKILNKEIEKKNDFLFSTNTGKKNVRTGVGSRFRAMIKAVKKIGLLSKDKNYKLHNCRSTYISNLLMAGVEPQKIMNIVGHKKWSTMQKYLHLAPEYGIDIIEKLPY
ncbi:tyrosine-type recombinase/integrase [Candidatus Uabimicrobium sp. HlEnr_7]|uniref:tyrosine-type recombinase/integrase n=1 Tax=Candidatus Uabimicrobium helgolandensis TaxID=3095367 RepID=UPI003557BC66